jgi:hypothetical protein
MDRVDELGQSCCGPATPLSLYATIEQSRVSYRLSMERVNLSDREGPLEPQRSLSVHPKAQADHANTARAAREAGRAWWKCGQSLSSREQVRVVVATRIEDECTADVDGTVAGHGRAAAHRPKVRRGASLSSSSSRHARQPRGTLAHRIIRRELNGDAQGQFSPS